MEVQIGTVYHNPTENAIELDDTDWTSTTIHKDSQGNTLELSRSATLVVAASDASAKSKAGADYVCDGTADDVEINAALTAHGKVVCSAGNFYSAGTIYPADSSLEMPVGSILHHTVAAAAFTLQGDGISNHTANLDIYFMVAEGAALNVAAGIRDLGINFSKIKINVMMSFGTSYFFDAANATFQSTLNEVDINYMAGGSYGLRLDSIAGFHMEGCVFNIGAIANQTVLCARIGSSAVQGVVYNKFTLGLDGGAITPKLLEVYNGYNDFDLTAALNATGTPAVEIMAGAEETFISGEKIQSISDHPKTSQILSVGRGLSNRNAIINGAMDIWQRGAAFVGTPGVYTADRWKTGATTQATTVTRIATGAPSGADDPTALYYLRFQRNVGEAATDNMYFFTALETKDSKRFAGQTVTISFRVRAGANFSGAASQMKLFLETGTGTDQNPFTPYTGVRYPINGQAITITATWARYQISVALNADTNEIGFMPYWTPVGVAGANDYLDITEVQLELGSVATPFEFRPYQQELALCKRYAKVQAFYIPAIAVPQCQLIDMRGIPVITGGGAGYDSTGTTADTIVHGQTAGAVATLTLVAEL